MSTQSNFREAEFSIASMFLDRWSPRAYTAEAISDETLLSFIDAARWAPSAYNHQPWRFLYARRDTEHWATYLSLLNEFNRSWAKQASALVVVISRTVAQPPGAAAASPNPTYAFDAGAAWGYLALQASLAGWQAHGMAGFDRDRARSQLHIPEEYEVLAAVALGRIGDKSSLPESLQAREAPSPRLPLTRIVYEGIYAD